MSTFMENVQESTKFGIIGVDLNWNNQIIQELCGTGRWEHAYSCNDLDGLISGQLFNIPCDVLLIDFYLPKDRTALDCLPTLTGLLRNTSFVLVSAMNIDVFIYPCIKAGADGFLKKRADFSVFVRELEILREEGATISPELAAGLFAKIRPKNALSAAEKIHLTPIEWNILNCLAQGYTYEGGASHLRMSINTFRYYIKKVYKSLNIESSREAVRWFMEQQSTRQAV